ncbi:hypothetical protein GCM10010388_74940 [Streptomyces mauvecolor]
MHPGPVTVQLGGRLSLGEGDFVVVDGTLIPTDQIRADEPYYWQKHKKHGTNVQAIARPDSTPLWISRALAGRSHDLTAARAHRIVQACRTRQVLILADRAYQEAGATVRTPYHHYREQPEHHQQYNRDHARLLAPGERAFARLKTWRLLRTARCSAGQGGREPQGATGRISDDLHVHAVLLVLRRVVRAPVADPVALGECAVHENRVGGPSRAGPSAGPAPCRQVLDCGGDVRMGGGGADGDTESRGEMSQGSCRRRCARAITARSDGRSWQRPSPSRMTIGIVTHSTSACGRSSAARCGDNRAPGLES